MADEWIGSYYLVTFIVGWLTSNDFIIRIEFESLYTNCRLNTLERFLWYFCANKYFCIIKVVCSDFTTFFSLLSGMISVTVVSIMYSYNNQQKSNLKPRPPLWNTFSTVNERKKPLEKVSNNMKNDYLIRNEFDNEWEIYWLDLSSSSLMMSQCGCAWNSLATTNSFSCVAWSIMVAICVLGCLTTK